MVGKYRPTKKINATTFTFSHNVFESLTTQAINNKVKDSALVHTVLCFANGFMDFIYKQVNIVPQHALLQLNSRIHNYLLKKGHSNSL